MLFRFEICLNAIPENPFSRHVTGQSLKEAIRKVDRTLLRVRGKKVAHIISVEEVSYSDAISAVSSSANIAYSTYAYSYTAPSMITRPIGYYSTNTTTAATSAAYSNYYASSASTLATGYYSANTTTI